MSWFWIVSLFLFFQTCSGVIYDLNETEYDRMPPLFGLEEYGRCLRTDGTYCMVELTLHADPPNQLFTMIQEYSNYRTKHYNYSFIDRGVCVTKTCEKYIKNKNISGTTAELEGILEACLNESIFKEYGLQAKVREVSYCDRQDDRKETDVYQILVAVIIVAMLGMNVVGTIYDAFFCKGLDENDGHAGNPYLLSFSIRRNWETLVQVRPETCVLYRLRGLNGIRVLCMWLAIAGHTGLLIGNYIDNPHHIEKYLGFPTLIRLMSVGTSVVQIFFMMSAFLFSYRVLLAEEKSPLKTRDLPKLILGWWWRLTPVYALCLAYSATWLERLGSGPLWGTLRTTVVRDCRRYWWLHLLYLNNYVPDDVHCMAHTWYIAADVQLFVLGAVVMVVLRRWRLQALLVLLAVGVATPAVVVWRNDLDARLLTAPEFYRDGLRDTTQTFDLLYKPAHTNMVCFTLGLLAGMLCHRFLRTGLKINNYKFLTPFFAFVIPAMMALLLTGLRYYDLPTPAPLAERAAYAALMHVVLGAILTVGLIGIVLGYDAGLVSYMQWRGWTVLSRLSYGVYLMHWLLLQVLAASRTGLNHASFLYAAIYFVGVYGLSHVMSLMIYLTVEGPCDSLFKSFFRRNEKTPGKKVE